MDKKKVTLKQFCILAALVESAGALTKTEIAVELGEDAAGASAWINSALKSLSKKGLIVAEGNPGNFSRKYKASSDCVLSDLI